jgi:hypothetical protein
MMGIPTIVLGIVVAFSSMHYSRIWEPGSAYFEGLGC